MLCSLDLNPPVCLIVRALGSCCSVPRRSVSCGQAAGVSASLKAHHSSGQPRPWAPGKGPWWVECVQGRGEGGGHCRVSPLTLLHHCSPVPLGRDRAGGRPHLAQPSSLAVRRLSEQEGQGRRRPRLLGESVPPGTGQGALGEEGEGTPRVSFRLTKSWSSSPRVYDSALRRESVGLGPIWVVLVGAGGWESREEVQSANQVLAPFLERQASQLPLFLLSVC